MPQTIDFIERYAERISAPVRTNTVVKSVRRIDGGYQVATSQGDWDCRTIVLATGACNLANVPKVGASLPPSITALSPIQYRNPSQIEPGGVLVVGASASGTQIAEELHRSGRPVTLSLGEHVRVPRVYRGRDIKWWMDVVGVLDEFYTEVDDITRVRNVPSLQLAGSDERRTVDLNSLTDIGVKLRGRLAGIASGKAQFSGSLPNLCALADLKMNRLLDRIDEWAVDNLGAGEVDPPLRFDPTRVEGSPPLGMDLSNGDIKTVIWATGFRPDYSWLDVPVIDRKGRLRHDGGVVESPGMYLMGIPFLRRRKSSLIDGAADDARDLSAHLAAHLDGRTAVPSARHETQTAGGAK
jgi:putative flavoprotein involved in K+ transport